MHAFLFNTVLGLNALWFGIAFGSFSLRPLPAAKLLVPPHTRSSPLFEIVAASLRFLGGMNLAMALFAVLLLLFGHLFPLPVQRALFAAVFAMGHGTQFAGNVPIALGRSSLWPVWRGPMRLIFAVDFTLMAANAAVCILHLLRPVP
ncbi:hypothetical protein LVJ94_21705 [Pendulispora rubella]|uniref:DUF4149 domain-containing protein n=1 Tax=Pendulispora rubella TaxID=2741070 RepID=A0ABZ2LFY2_9BACT